MSLPAFPDSVPLTAFRLPRNSKRYRYSACAIVCHTATSIYGNLICDALFLTLSVVSSQAPFPYFVRVFALRFRTSSLDAVLGQFQGEYTHRCTFLLLLVVRMHGTPPFSNRMGLSSLTSGLHQLGHIRAALLVESAGDPSLWGGGCSPPGHCKRIRTTVHF